MCYFCSLCSYSKVRRQSFNIFQGHINSHNPQDELVWKFLRFLKENQWGVKSHFKSHLRVLLFLLDEFSPSVHSN